MLSIPLDFECSVHCARSIGVGDRWNVGDRRDARDRWGVGIPSRFTLSRLKRFKRSTMDLTRSDRAPACAVNSTDWILISSPILAPIEVESLLSNCRKTARIG